MYGHLLSLSVCVSFVIASWFEFKSGPSGKKLKPESVLFQVQHYALDSLDNLWQPRRMGMGVISLSYIGHRLFHIGEHGEFPVISNVV